MALDIGYMELSHSKCKPCEAGVPPMSEHELEIYRNDPEFTWDIVDNKKIVKDFHFNSYPQVIAFVTRVGELAEEEGHHPVMHVYFERVVVEFWTHAIDGLSENDFIMAAKIDEINI